MSREIVETLYRAFGARDGVRMAEQYAPDARFSDPVFVDLRGPEIGRMWRMLCERAVDLSVELREVEVAGAEGRARWEARYRYSATRRLVHNVVTARFRFAGDRIVEHEDSFDLWRWTRMALGPVGIVLGWSPFVRSTVRRKGMEGLRRFGEGA